MKIRRRWLALPILVCALVWALGPSVIHFFAQEAINRLHERGIRIRVDGLEGTRFGLTADTIEGWVSVPLQGSKKAFPVALKVESAVVNIRFPLRSPWAPQLTFTGSAYGGSLRGQLDGLTGTPALRVSIEGADLSLHPQARAFGLEAGTLNAAVDGHPLQGVPRDEARYSIDVQSFSLNLPPIVSQVAKVNSVSEGKVSAKAVVKSNGRFSIEPCTFTSSLGTMTLTAHGEFLQGNINGVWGSAGIDLSTEQGLLLRPWFGLLAPTARLPAQGPIRCEYRSGSCANPSGTQFALGSVCVRLECGS